MEHAIAAVLVAFGMYVSFARRLTRRQSLRSGVCRAYAQRGAGADSSVVGGDALTGRRAGLVDDSSDQLGRILAEDAITDSRLSGEPSVMGACPCVSGDFLGPQALRGGWPCCIGQPLDSSGSAAQGEPDFFSSCHLCFDSPGEASGKGLSLLDDGGVMGTSGVAMPLSSRLETDCMPGDRGYEDRCSESRGHFHAEAAMGAPVRGGAVIDSIEQSEPAGLLGAQPGDDAWGRSHGGASALEGSSQVATSDGRAEIAGRWIDWVETARSDALSDCTPQVDATLTDHTLPSPRPRVRGAQRRT